MWFFTQSHSDERKIFAPFKRTQKCHTPIINSVLPRCRKMPLGSKMFYWATKCDTFIAFTSSQIKLFRGFHFLKNAYQDMLRVKIYLDICILLLYYPIIHSEGI